MNENNLGRLIMLGLTKVKTTVFRNNTGMGWQGERINTTQGRDILLKDPRPLHAGLCTGSSDLIGWTTREITPDMVGKTVAVFTAIEVKMPNGRVTKEQLTFINRVKECGGIAGIARSPEEAKNLVQGMK